MRVLKTFNHLTSKGWFLIKLLSLLLLFILLLSRCSNETTNRKSGYTPAVPDTAITTTVENHLQDNPMFSAEDIDVRTREGIVTLSGSINNLLSRREALRITRSTRGVRSVINNLTIMSGRSDEAIRQDVQRAIDTNPATEQWEIDFEVNDAVVRLKGAVDSWHERRLAETVVKNVKGVVDVTNNITINYSDIRDEGQVAAEVKELLKWDSRIDDKLINVAVANNKVVLSGSAGSAYEKNLAIRHAHVSGIDEVDATQLTVRPEIRSQMVRTEANMELNPNDIEAAILKSWKYDPRIDDFNLKVSVKENTAILNGKVDNLKAKLAAESDAMNTHGVNQVENEIQVENKVIVRPDISVRDDSVAQRINFALARNPYVDATQIDVEVENGIATLNGTVISDFLKNKAEEVANSTLGVLEVNNNINVSENNEVS